MLVALVGHSPSGVAEISRLLWNNDSTIPCRTTALFFVHSLFALVFEWRGWKTGPMRGAVRLGFFGKNKSEKGACLLVVELSLCRSNRQLAQLLRTSNKMDGLCVKFALVSFYFRSPLLLVSDDHLIPTGERRETATRRATVVCFAVAVVPLAPRIKEIEKGKLVAAVRPSCAATKEKRDRGKLLQRARSSL